MQAAATATAGAKEPANSNGSGTTTAQQQRRVKYAGLETSQRLAAIEDVRRVLREEVRADWIEVWEERWRRRVDVIRGVPGSNGRQRDDGDDAESEREDDDGEGEGEGDDDDDDDDWDSFWRGDGGGGGGGGGGEGGDIWVHRADDSDLLKSADGYRPPSTSTPCRSSPATPQQQQQPGSPGRTGESWVTASMTRLMGGIGLGPGPAPNPPQLHSTYPSSTTTTPTPTPTPTPTAETTPATISVPGTPPPPSSAPTTSPYRFASPDSVTVTVTAAANPPTTATPNIDLDHLPLREQRQQELSRQLDLTSPEGNPGLRCWVERRDRWTGADSRGRVRVCRSRFADNPLTNSVNETAYPSIYNKCIKKAIPPVLPINLRHITKAMVAGWKRDGEWPPPVTAPEPSFARRGGGGRGRGVGVIRSGGGPGGGSAAVRENGGGAGGGAGQRRVLGML